MSQALTASTWYGYRVAGPMRMICWLRNLLALASESSAVTNELTSIALRTVRVAERGDQLLVLGISPCA